MELTTIIAITLYTISAFALAITAIQFIRLNLLSKEIHRILDDVYERRMAGLKNKVPYDECVMSNPYPDIDATYGNLKWTTFWKRPSTLIVYDKKGIL